MTNLSCDQCPAFNRSVWHLALPNEFANLVSHKSTKTFKLGEIIIEQDSEMKFVYCICHGLIKLESLGLEGEGMTLGLLSTGDILGLGPVLAKFKTTARAVALEDTIACAFHADLIRDLVAKSPKFALTYVAKLLQDLRKTQERLLSGIEKNVAARVAESVLYLKATFPDHHFTRREIAEWAGTTTESVIRTLSTFEHDAVIKRIGRQITIQNYQLLNKLAGLVV